MGSYSKIDTSSRKLEIIKRNIDNLSGYIDTICDNRSVYYEVKKDEWTKKRASIKSILEREQYFLFIGRFSSGKSSFINALLGQELLPTDSRPCTSVVTEVSFVDSSRGIGYSDEGKIVYMSGDKETKSRDELLEIIKGKSQTAVGSIHHVEIKLDVNNDFEEKQQGVFKPFVGKIVLVDCPGFDSPYGFPEDVLYEYVEKSSFTFYLMPSNDFGGINEVKRLTNLHKRTATLIPLISKADLINDDEEKEMITEKFESLLSGKFDNQEAIFISTYKYKELQKFLSGIEGKILENSLTDEENQIWTKLLQECGIERVFNQMSSKSKDSVLNEKKLQSILFDFNEITEELIKASLNDKAHWEYELKRQNYDFDDNIFKDIEAHERKVNEYINRQAETVGDEIESKIAADVANEVMGGHPDSGRLKEIYTTTVTDTISRHKDEWEKFIKEKYNVNTDSIGDLDGKAPDFPINIPLSYLPMAVVGGLGHSSDSVVKAMEGGALLAASSAVSSIPVISFIAAPLTAILGIGGVALLGIALVKVAPHIKDNIVREKEKKEETIQRQIRSILDNPNMNFKASIKTLLTDYKEKVMKAVRSGRDEQAQTLLTNYKKSIEIHDTLYGIKQQLNQQLS